MRIKTHGWPTPMAPTDGSTETGANGLVDVPPDRLCDRPSRRATAVDGASLAHAAPGSLTSVGAQVARRSAQRRVLEGSPAPVAYSSPGRTAASVTRSERDFGSGSQGCETPCVIRAQRSTVHVCVSALPALSISLIYFVTRVASHGDNTLRSTRHTTTKSPPGSRPLVNTPLVTAETSALSYTDSLSIHARGIVCNIRRGGGLSRSLHRLEHVL